MSPETWLLLVFFAIGPQSGVNITVIETSSQLNCEKARNQITAVNSDYIDAVCIKK